MLKSIFSFLFRIESKVSKRWLPALQLEYDKLEQDEKENIKMLSLAVAPFVGTFGHSLKENVNKYFNDYTVRELAVFYLHNLKQYLYINGDNRWIEKTDLQSYLYLRTFNLVVGSENENLTVSTLDEFIKNRLAIYGSFTKNRKQAESLLFNFIDDCHQFKQHRSVQTPKELLIDRKDFMQQQLFKYYLLQHLKLKYPLLEKSYELIFKGSFNRF